MFVCHAQVTKCYRYDKPKCLPRLSYRDLFLLCHCPHCDWGASQCWWRLQSGAGSVCHPPTVQALEEIEAGRRLESSWRPARTTQWGRSQKTNNKQEQKKNTKRNPKCSWILNAFPRNYLGLFLPHIGIQARKPGSGEFVYQQLAKHTLCCGLQSIDKWSSGMLGSLFFHSGCVMLAFVLLTEAVYWGIDMNSDPIPLAWL